MVVSIVIVTLLSVITMNTPYPLVLYKPMYTDMDIKLPSSEYIFY